ncbi:hypothetical protein BH11ARM2_BH11ARM2_33050 [soil metagenome]
MGAIWEVRLFGGCSADCHGTPAHLATYKHWAAFACLVLEPLPLSRSALAARFWRNDKHGRASLSTALLDIRKTFGRETLQTDAETVALADPAMFGVDVLDFLRLFRDAARASDPQARLQYLEAACELARGPFMARHDRLREESWVGEMRTVLHAHVEESFRLLIDACAATGRTRDAATAASRLQEWSPDPLSVQTTPSGAERLAVFPATFLAGAARRIAGVDTADLLRLESMGMALRAEGRWSLHPDARQSLAERLSVETLRRLEVRHARYYRDLAQGMAARSLLDPLGTHRREGEERNFQAAFHHLLARRPSARILDFMDGMRTFGFRSLDERGAAWCEGVLANVAVAPEIRSRAAYSAAQFRMSLFEYRQAARDLEAGLAFSPSSTSEENLRFLLAVALHHAGEGEAALHHAEWVSRRPSPPVATEALRFLGEIHRAAGRYDLARDIAQKALAKVRDLGANPLQTAEALYQLAKARWRCGEIVGAEEAFLQSLEIRLAYDESNGVADCLRGLARLREAQGRLAESWAFLEDARRRYREGEKDPALAATLEQMADIHLRRRDREAAYDALADARRHWQNAGDEPRARAAGRRLAALEP